MTAGAHAERASVSVLVAVRDGERTIGPLLECLRAQTLERSRFEVLVADDGSRDKTPELVRASGVARLIEAPAGVARRGAYAARNRALEQARAEVVAVTDADCRPAPDWLELGLAELDQLELDMLAGRVAVPLGPDPGIAELVDVARYLDQERRVEAGFAAFANFFCRHRVIERSGAFNERLISNGDREFCLRAGAAGFSLGYSSRAVVVHYPRRRVRDVATRCFRMGFGRAQTAYHGRGPARSRRRNWLPLRDYLPSAVTGRSPYGLDRLRACGYEPSRRELRSMELAGYWLVGAPVAAGYLCGSAAVRVRAGARDRRQAAS